MENPLPKTKGRVEVDAEDGWLAGGG